MSEPHVSTSVVDEAALGEAPIHASFERMMADLEGVLLRPDTIGTAMQTTTAKKAPNAKPAPAVRAASANQSDLGAAVSGAQKTAATNADNDMRGSQLQTALDRGDYGTQAEAIGAQAEETRRKAEVDKDPAGNQTQTIEYDHNDNRYVLARRNAAIETIAEFAPELAAQLRRAAASSPAAKRAEMVGPPMGGEPASVTQGREEAGAGDPAAVGGEPPPDVTTAPTGDSNLQGAIQQALEEQKQANESLQKAQMEADSARTVVEKLQAAAAGAPGADAGAGKSAAKTKQAAAPETTDTLPGHGSRVNKDNFAAKSISADSTKFPSSGDPDETLAAEARKSNDKSQDGPGNTAPSDRQSQRDAGSYPLKGASRATGAQVQNQTTPKAAAAAPAPKAAAPAKKTAEASDDIQPQSPITAPTEYSGDDAGSSSALPEIDAGTTPTIESAETRKIADEGNREVSSESKSSMTGSVSAKLQPAFSKEQRKNLIAECKAIDAAREALSARIAHARKLLSQGEEVAKTASIRVQALQKCGDAIEAALKKADVDETTGAKIRTATVDAVKLGRREVAGAKRDMAFLGAALIEAQRSRAREARLGPAFSLAIHQLQTGMLRADDLPAKVAEYLTMDGKTFEVVAKMVEETSAHVRHAARKTAARLPNIPEDPIARPKDELDGIFANNFGR